MKTNNNKRWHWIVVEVDRPERLRHSLNLVRLFADDQTPAYFCTRTSPPRLEIIVLTAIPWQRLRQRITALCKARNFSPHRLYRHPASGSNFSGSEACALARLVIHALNLRGHLINSRALTEVVHTMYNMAGFDVAQQVSAHLLAAQTLLRSLAPVHEAPVNSLYHTGGTSLLKQPPAPCVI